MENDVLGQYLFFEKETYKLRSPLQNLATVLEQLLKEEKKTRGRHTADENGLITRLAVLYDQLIDRPHPYKGPFPKIVDLILEDAEGKSQIKGIRQALKSLNLWKLKQISSNGIKHKNR
jgi:hypothetical protein